jgi:selenocysteine-specific elongation factor
MLKQLDARVIAKEPTFVLLNDAHKQLTERILTEVQQHHRLQPQAVGINLKVLRQRSALNMKAAVFLSLLKSIAAEKKIVILGSVVASTRHQPTASSSDQLMWQKIQPALITAGFKALTVEGLAESAGLKTLVLDELLHRKVKEGELYRLRSARFYTRANFIEFSKMARQLAIANPEQTFIAAQFRDIVGVNRVLAIEILEVLDRLGITQRVGDARKLFKSIESVFGSQ